MRIGDVHVFENQRRQQEFSPVLPLFVRPADLHRMDARAQRGGPTKKPPHSFECGGFKASFKSLWRPESEGSGS